MAEHTVVGFNEEQMKILQSYRRTEKELRDKIADQAAEMEQIRAEGESDKDFVRMITGPDMVYMPLVTFKSINDAANTANERMRLANERISYLVGEHKKMSAELGSYKAFHVEAVTEYDQIIKGLRAQLEGVATANIGYMTEACAEVNRLTEELAAYREIGTYESIIKTSGALDTMNNHLLAENEDLKDKLQQLLHENALILQRSNEHHREAIKARAEAKELQDANRWIPVTERFPVPELKKTGSNSYACLIVSHGIVRHGVFGKDGFDAYCFFTPRDFPLSDVTHWRPLPTPPEANA